MVRGSFRRTILRIFTVLSRVLGAFLRCFHETSKFLNLPRSTARKNNSHVIFSYFIRLTFARFSLFLQRNDSRFSHFCPARVVTISLRSEFCTAHRQGRGGCPRASLSMAFPYEGGGWIRSPKGEMAHSDALIQRGS